MLRLKLQKFWPVNRLWPETHMKQPPTINTERLVLRPFQDSDAEDVQRMAGHQAIADTTLNIPHPYSIDKARKWIVFIYPQFESGRRAVFAITHGGTREFIGAIELRTDRRYRRGELGYWIGKPHWGNGYCTEAGRAVMAFGFGPLKLNRIYANHFSRNQGSGRVLEKLGMLHEGHARQHIKKGDRFEDIENYGILKEEWEVVQDTPAR